MTKDELKEYEEERAMKHAKHLFEGGTLDKQSWRSSLLEAHINSLIGAPIAVVAHIALLIWSGIEPDWNNATVFATASWPIFFYLSVGRIYMFRRIFEKYGVHLEPVEIYRRLRGKKND